MATYTIYTLYTDLKLNLFCIRNKARAIQEAREFALEQKESTIVYKGLERKPVAICEFPNYLRNLKLDIRDIKVNKIEEYEEYEPTDEEIDKSVKEMYTGAFGE